MQITGFRMIVMLAVLLGNGESLHAQAQATQVQATQSQAMQPQERPTQQTQADSIQLLQKSITDYDTAKWPEATAALEELFKSGHHNGYLLYNLGNSYYKQNDLAAATAAFLAARHYLPRDGNVEANLRLVMQKSNASANSVTDGATAGNGFAASAFLAWPKKLSPRESAWLFSTSLGVLLASLGFYWYGNKRRGLWIKLAAGALAATMITGFAWSVRVISPDQWGAVSEDEVAVFIGPSTNESRLFTLKLATPVLIVRRENGWNLIETADARRGWLSANAIRNYITPDI